MRSVHLPDELPWHVGPSHRRRPQGLEVLRVPGMNMLKFIARAVYNIL